MAGALKRNNPHLSEEVVLIRALTDSNMPKFLDEDMLLFTAIVNVRRAISVSQSIGAWLTFVALFTQDLFPGTNVTANVDDEFDRALAAELQRSNLQQVHDIVL